ncbi:MAG: DUF732 domain-containing protein [Ilumatobacteraceae bacterium]
MKLARGAILAVAMAVALAVPAHADPDTDFANELHTYGIYGQKDYNAWIGKITCKRIWNHLDQDANASASFVHRNLQRGSSTAQAWQFLGAAIQTYCPDNLPFLQAAALPSPAPGPGDQPPFGAEAQ